MCDKGLLGGYLSSEEMQRRSPGGQCVVEVPSAKRGSGGASANPNSPDPTRATDVLRRLSLLCHSLICVDHRSGRCRCELYKSGGHLIYSPQSSFVLEHYAGNAS